MSTVSTVEAFLATLLSGDTSVIPVLEDAILEGVTDAGKARYGVIDQKGYKRGSYVQAAKRVVARYTVVIPGKSIRVVGLAYPTSGNIHGDQCAYDRSFELGDVVEYDSFNLSYHGEITSIGAGPNVTVAHPHSKRSTRLDADRFTSRNWDLNLGEAFERNSLTMMAI